MFMRLMGLLLMLVACKTYGLELNVRENMTIGELKLKICTEKDIPVMQQRIIANGKELQDPQKTLKEYGVYEDTLVHVIVGQQRHRKNK